MVITDEQTRVNTEKVNDFEKTYHHSYLDTVIEIWKWYSYILPEKRDYSIEEIYKTYRNCISRADNEPMKLVKYEGQKYIGGYEWVFKGCIYEVKGFYSDDEIKLLILEDFDRERKCFEKLNVKFNQTVNSGATYERSRIPENIRIEVWRRDGGKCARCGSREKLEYDHIVPISKGGSNTARNIELLCEKCNRSKSNNVV
ncbi:MAG: HNH endonuclease [Chloroflexi bacterium]|nr:HNH endonuclease [Chloroflexota bacterium]